MVTEDERKLNDEGTRKKDDTTARKAAQNPLETASREAPPEEKGGLNWSGPVALVVIAVIVMLVFALVIL